MECVAILARNEKKCNNVLNIKFQLSYAVVILRGRANVICDFGRYICYVDYSGRI
jgi:hypothetical protein